MKPLILFIFVLAGLHAEGRPYKELGKIIKEKYLSQQDSPLETAWANMLTDGTYGRTKFEKDRTLYYYERLGAKDKQYVQLDSPIDKVERKWVVNPIRWVGRLWRNTLALPFGVDRDMVKVRFTSSSRKTQVECYYVEGTQFRYLFDCGEIKERNAYENEELYEIEKALELAEDCKTAHYIHISSRAWREKPPSNAKELSLFKEFDQKIGFEKINALRSNLCDETYLLTDFVADLIDLIESCDEIHLFKQKINEMYDSSDEITRKVYDEEFKDKVNHKVMACADSQEEDRRDLLSEAVVPDINFKPRKEAPRRHFGEHVGTDSKTRIINTSLR